jgi:hypothetical protein
MLVGMVVGENLPLVGGVEDDAIARARQGGDVGGDLPIVVAGVGGVEVEVVERGEEGDGEDGEEREA